MEIEVTRKIKTNIKYFNVSCSKKWCRCEEDIAEIFDCDTFEEVFEKYPSLKNIESGDFILSIDIDTGKVINWPDHVYGAFNTIKIVDEGKYTILDKDYNVIESRQDYVPDMLEINCDGYGDYFEFTIDTNGKIINWDKVSKKDFIDFIECDYD